MAAADPTVREMLRTVQFLQTLSVDDLTKVAAIASVEYLAPSTVLFQEGSLCDRLYVVSSGLVALDMCMPRRGCVRILTVGPREIVGLSALLSDSRMTARATIVESSTLIALPAQQLRDLCDGDHDIGYAVMKELSQAMMQRLLATRLQLLDVFIETQPTEQGVAQS